MRKLTQKAVLFFLLFTLIFQAFSFVSVNTTSAQAPIQIVINGQVLPSDTPPLIMNDRTVVPLRAIFEALGADIEWNQQEKSVTATREGQHIYLKVNAFTASINGSETNLDQPPVIVNDRVLVPVRFVAESLGAEVDWNQHERQVIITYKLPITEFSFRGIMLNDSKTKVLHTLGEPNRVALSEYGFEWYIYHNEYKDYVQIGISSTDQVVALYSNTTWDSPLGISLGTAKKSARSLLGKALEYIEKDKAFYMLPDDDNQDTYTREGYFLTVFYDQHDQHKVTAVQLILHEIELSLVGFYAVPTDRLKVDFEYMHFDLTNATRVRFGLPILTWSNAALPAARNHSEDMAINNYFDHTSLDGRQPWDRLSTVGVRYSTAAENLTSGFASPIFSHEALMNSYGHRVNILGKTTRLAVGYYFNEQNIPYCTQKYYTPR